jgi:hypothetical protein
MDRYTPKRAWYRTPLSRSRRAARRSDRWQGICGSPRRAEYETCRIEGKEAPAAGPAQRSQHVEAPKSSKTFKGAIQTANAFDLSRVPRRYEPRHAGLRTQCHCRRVRRPGAVAGPPRCIGCLHWMPATIPGSSPGTGMTVERSFRLIGTRSSKGKELRIPCWRISGGFHFGGCACLKYLKSGGAWSFLVGIKNPSPLRKYVSVPMTT